MSDNSSDLAHFALPSWLPLDTSPDTSLSVMSRVCSDRHSPRAPSDSALSSRARPSLSSLFCMPRNKMLRYSHREFLNCPQVGTSNKIPFTFSFTFKFAFRFSLGFSLRFAFRLLLTLAKFAIPNANVWPSNESVASVLRSERVHPTLAIIRLFEIPIWTKLEEIGRNWKNLEEVGRSWKRL